MADQVTTSLAQAKVLVMEGQKGADGDPGPQGEQGIPGANGVSPVVTFAEITVGDRTGNRMTVTDADHPSGQSINILNGKDGEGGGSSVTVDSALSTASTNPVQNKVITAELNDVKDDLHTAQYDIADIQEDLVNIPTFNEMNAAIDRKYTKPSGGIPKTDLASDVQTSLGKADTALQQHQSLAGYATETWVNQQGFLKQHQDISGKADKVLRVAMTASDTTPTLDPNKLYVFPEMATLTPTLAAPTDNTIVNEYHFVFDSGSTATVLTLPATILQPDGFTVEANMHYEVSILEGAMTAQGWAVTA